MTRKLYNEEVVFDDINEINHRVSAHLQNELVLYKEQLDDLRCINESLIRANSSISSLTKTSNHCLYVQVSI